MYDMGLIVVRDYLSSCTSISGTCPDLYGCCREYSPVCSILLKPLSFPLLPFCMLLLPLAFCSTESNLFVRWSTALISRQSELLIRKETYDKVNNIFVSTLSNK